ncbi:unnamed protein product [Meloidogyne enterolobii]|uniref:Uncharacterized protein n=1 Tax=Meloidogyne enterolobii TaxID=390850 RepID=A0ACB0XTK5_MELEN
MRRRLFFKDKVKQRLFRSVSCSSIFDSLRRFSGKVVRVLALANQQHYPLLKREHLL